MRFRTRRWWALVLAAAVIGGARAEAQVAATFDANNGVSGMVPQAAPEGVWAEVVTATPKWLVLQNEAGQQFPVSLDEVQLFLMRWPTAPNLLSPEALVEVTGVDVDSNRVRADHVDVYDGSSRALVTPTSQTIIGYNRVLTPYDIDQMNTYGVYFPLLPGESLLPRRRHVVGPIVGISPLVVGVPGIAGIAVFPGANGLSMTLVTLGSSSLVRGGDRVWCLPQGSSAKSLSLAQLVVYKSMPINQFAP